MPTKYKVQKSNAVKSAKTDNRVPCGDVNDAWEGCVGGLLTSSLCYEILLSVLAVWALMAARSITSARGTKNSQRCVSHFQLS